MVSVAAPGSFSPPSWRCALARAAVARCDAATRPQVLIVRDTRESGEMLEAAIAAGVTAAGGDALLAGVLPTPAAPLLVRRHGLELAAVISASHNPYAGQRHQAVRRRRLQAERRRRARDRGRARASTPRRATGSAACERCTGRSRTTCESSTPALRGSISQGAGSCSTAPTARPTAPRRRSSAGSARTSRCSPTSPTGATSTTGCGSTHLGEHRRAHVRAGSFDLGFAFDGDGDRVLAVDRNGDRRRRRRAGRARRASTCVTAGRCAAVASRSR